MTPSVYRDRERIKEICDMINERILYYHSPNIKHNCYKWFRDGNRLKVPQVKDLLDMCLFTPMGALQYVNYKKNNEVALIHYLEKEEVKTPIFEKDFNLEEKEEDIIE